VAINLSIGPGAYRLFSKQRVDVSQIMNVVQSNVLKETECLPYIVAHMDDTVIKKTGKRIPGTAWRRDPLGPPFYTNFIWGQRFIQMSLALPHDGQIGQSRAIPVDFHHCPTVVKPKKTAEKEQWEAYKEEKKIAKLSRQGAERIALLRKTLDEQGYKDKELVVGVDGSYTNKEVLKNLPQRTTLIGRIRKDTKLAYAARSATRIGSQTRIWNKRLPTPEEIRQSDGISVATGRSMGCGQNHKFER
jgi:hypothetical protein